MRFSVVLILLLSSSFGSFAHEGEDHSAPPAKFSVPLAPRVEAHSEEIALLGVLESGKLVIYLDRYATNEPIQNARIEIESGSYNAVAVASSNDVYIAAADALSRPGKHLLVFSIQVNDVADLLNGTLVVPEPSGGPGHSHDWGEWAVWIMSALGIVLGLGWMWLRRRKEQRT